MAWAPQRSKDTYAPIRSIAYARTHGGIEQPPDPPGSIMYLVCNRRRQIWALKPNQTGSGPAFQVLATRGPLWADTQQLRSVMGDIGGDSSGAWYIETPNALQTGGPPKVTYSGDDGINRTVTPTIHRLAPDLSLVASYALRWSQSAGIFGLGAWGLQTGMGGGGGTVIMAAQQVDFLASNGDSIFLPGGLVSASISAMQSQATRVFQNGTSWLLAKAAATPQATWNGTAVAASGGLPLPNYGNILDPINPQITSCDGSGGNVYACKVGGADYMARWSGGQLVAYKTPANATQQDQFRAQCIGGSSSVCYTTENNNEIVLRDGALNLVRRLLRAELDTILGPTNPANGISNYTFTGIGGR